MNKSDKITEIPITSGFIMSLHKIEEDVYKVQATKNNTEPVFSAIFHYNDDYVPFTALYIMYQCLMNGNNPADTIVLYAHNTATSILNDTDRENLLHLLSQYKAAAKQGQHTPATATAGLSATVSAIETPAGTVSIKEHRGKDSPSITLELTGIDAKPVSTVTLEYNKTTATLELLVWPLNADPDKDEPGIRHDLSPARYIVYDNKVDLCDNTVKEARLRMKNGMACSDSDIIQILKEQSTQQFNDVMERLSTGRKAKVPKGKTLVKFSDTWNGTTKAYYVMREGRDLSAFLTEIIRDKELEPGDRLQAYSDGEDIRAVIQQRNGTHHYLLRIIDDNKIDALEKETDYSTLISMTESVEPTVASVCGLYSCLLHDQNNKGGTP